MSAQFAPATVFNKTREKRHHSQIMARIRAHFILFCRFHSAVTIAEQGEEGVRGAGDWQLSD